MVLPTEEKLVHSIRLSSVGPGRVTGTDVVHVPSPMDLAMKLHYLTGVYYFSSQATQGLTIKVIKESMFTWLNDYYVTCGRFRRSPDSGRPFMKCNDCGVRFIEAKCDKTIDEWLELLREDSELRKLLVSDQVIGPELSFSPPLLIQISVKKVATMVGALENKEMASAKGAFEKLAAASGVERWRRKDIMEMMEKKARRRCFHAVGETQFTGVDGGLW